MSLKPVKKILCPVDFSEYSRETLWEAFTMAEHYGAELLILNVVNERLFAELERMGGRVGGLGEVAEQAINSLEDERAQQLRELLAEMHEDGISHDKVPHSSLVTVGVPWERILETAREESVDLIVMGAKGRTSLTKALRFGSSAEKVFRRATCRVLFVR